MLPGPGSWAASWAAAAVAAAAAFAAAGLALPAGAASDSVSSGEVALACAGVPQPKSAGAGESLTQAYAKAVAQGGPRKYIVKALDQESEAVALAYLSWNWPGFVADEMLSEFSMFVATLEGSQLLGIVEKLGHAVEFVECDQAVSLGGSVDAEAGGAISLSWPLGQPTSGPGAGGVGPPALNGTEFFGEPVEGGVPLLSLGGGAGGRGGEGEDP